MAANYEKSAEIMAEARKWIPGGVNSPVRAFTAVGGEPPVIRKGAGAVLTDEDGNEYIDLMGSWGPLILGHSHPAVVAALGRTLEEGTSFGAPTEKEARLARELVELIPSLDKVRLVSSGTEAAMSAARLARGFTGRNGLIKFEGCYHGHSDFFLIKAGSGAMTLGQPSSPGVTSGAAEDTLCATFNDLDSVEKLFKQKPHTIAALIVEPVAGNMGMIPPAPGFLSGLRRLCSAHGALLIFDEVITGFRVGLGGAQSLYQVTPDLTVFGKIIGAGLPVGAYGGREEIMDQIAPDGPVYQAGTLSGNPLAVSAGLAALELLRDENPYPKLETLSARLEAGLRVNLEKLKIPHQYHRVGSMHCCFFTKEPVTDFASAAKSNTKFFGRYFREMLDRGVYLPPSQFETYFLSTAHTEEQVDRVIEMNAQALEAASQ